MNNQNQHFSFSINYYTNMAQKIQLSINDFFTKLFCFIINYFSTMAQKIKFSVNGELYFLCSESNIPNLFQCNITVKKNSKICIEVFSTLTKIYSSVFVTNVHFSPKDTDLKDKLDRKKLPKHEYSQNEAWKDFLTSAQKPLSSGILGVSVRSNWSHACI